MATDLEIAREATLEPIENIARNAGFLPESFRASIVAACERSINAVLADNAVVLADTIVEKVLQPADMR